MLSITLKNKTLTASDYEELLKDFCDYKFRSEEPMLLEKLSNYTQWDLLYMGANIVFNPAPSELNNAYYTIDKNIIEDKNLVAKFIFDNEFKNIKIDNIEKRA